VLSLNPELAQDSIVPDAYTDMLGGQVGHIPRNEAEALLDIALAKFAVGIATERHAGRIKTEFSGVGEVSVQYGKNLLHVKNILGTGGIFKYGRRPEAVLDSALFSPEAPWSLRPRTPKAWVDDGYLMYAIGLLSQDYPDEALRIVKKYIKPVGGM
jgi:uncharacterized protein (TIGR01319 family)